MPEDDDTRPKPPSAPPPPGADPRAETVVDSGRLLAIPPPLPGPRADETYLAISPDTLARPNPSPSPPTRTALPLGSGEETSITGVTRLDSATNLDDATDVRPRSSSGTIARAPTPRLGTPRGDPFAAALFDGLGCLGRYQIEKQLGRGGMGAVYLARQLDLDRRVVVKVISGDDISFALVERLQREARTAARITSDFVVKVFEAGHIEDVPFIAMEYVEGSSLEDLIRDSGPLTPVEATRLVIDAARGLEAAHEAGVLHRDIKPGNILRTRDGRAKVADFGLAKGPVATVAGLSLTDPGTTLGTPEYMAPEQTITTENLDARADVYALGVTYYQILSGALPFQGRSALDTLNQKLTADLTPLRSLDPRIPESIEAACLAMVTRSRDERIQSMGAVVKRLEAALATLPDAPLLPPVSIAIPNLGKSTLKPETFAEDPAKDDLPVPGRFGRYELRRLLGRGGMGAVYLAHELELDRPVVVKVIHSHLARNKGMVERMRREAKAAGRIASDFVVKVFDAGDEGDRPFIAMEYVEGISLSTLLHRKGHLGVQEATRAVIGAARGLKAAHEAGILHRDVKPANILLGRNGRVKVADFGIAKPQDAADITTLGTLIGTPVYAAPEQIDGEKLDARADIFSLGVTYYVLLTGKVPYTGKTTLDVLASRQAPLVPPHKHMPSLPANVERAVLALMEIKPAKRPADMAAVLALLTPLVTESKDSHPALAVDQKKARGWLVPALVGAAVAAVAFLVIWRVVFSK